MRNENCTLCNNPTYKQIYKVKNCSVVRCLNCFHTYSLINEDVDLNEMYSKGDYEVFDTKETLLENIIYFENNLIFQRIKRIGQTGDLLLDFGCGKGKFLHAVKNNNWKTLGIETSIPRATYGIKNYDLRINTNLYVDGEIEGGPFDVITLFHVLEHLYKPSEIVSNLSKYNLKNGGLLVIEVPNFDSWQSRIAKSDWLHLDLPKHINHFNKGILKKLISNQNFRIIKIENFSFISGVLGMSNSILNVFGFKKSLMSELKYNRSIGLLIKLICVLPISFLLEILASLFNAGGVIRIYAKKEEKV